MAAVSERVAVDDLVLQVSDSFDPTKFDLAAYEDFIEAIAGTRRYAAEAIRACLIYLCGGGYESTEDLANESFSSQPQLESAYGTAESLVKRLPFPDKLACSIDLATATGKSYVMFAIARVLLNEGAVTRVLVLCPTKTIESGLIDKFGQLLADSGLTALLPERGGTRLPDLVDASKTVKEGQICIENIHQAYETAGSSIADSFKGQGAQTLVLSDEAHHLHSPAETKLKKWHEILADEDYGFQYHVGLSGTCYVGNDYFADVIYRYAIREAINDGWVKDIYYVEKDDSKTVDERFQKLLTQHEQNRKTYKPLKPITIAVTKTITAAKELGEQLIDFLADHLKGGRKEAEKRVLVVTSDDEHEKNLTKLASVDKDASAVEWIVSVSMLSEGWDVKNVFQIYPHEKRAFNSRLLIAQVLGRGLRLPEGTDEDPRVYVFNHAKWSGEVDGLVAAVIDKETTIWQRPTDARSVDHFKLHQLKYKQKPTGIKAKKAEKPKEIKSLSLSPQLDAKEKTEYIGVGSASKQELITDVEQRYEPVSRVVKDVRSRLLAADKKTGGKTASAYPKEKVEKLIKAGLKRIKAKGSRVSEENRNRILSAFGAVQQRTTRAGAVWEQKPESLVEISTEDMNPVAGRISALTGDLALYYDDVSKKAVDGDDAAALKKAIELDKETPTRLTRVSNSFLFKSPVNVALASHSPEREFVDRLLEHENATKIRAWVKAPDVGFYEIEYGYERNGRRKYGKFNPDSFLFLEASDTVVVVETKADGDTSDVNRGKADAASKHFEAVNGLLAKGKKKRRYDFHFLSPGDYDKFFEALRGGKLDSFRSSLHADLTA